jgi:hypothetical protein
MGKKRGVDVAYGVTPIERNKVAPGRGMQAWSGPVAVFDISAWKPQVSVKGLFF